MFRKRIEYRMACRGENGKKGNNYTAGGGVREQYFFI